MQLYLHARRLILFVITIFALTLFALGGVATQSTHGTAQGSIRLAYADGCDGANPRPDVDCPPTPTPTPTPDPGH